LNAYASDLTNNVVAFFEHLRGEHRFSIGPREATDALRAMEAIGIADRERVRSALRIVSCGTHAQTLVFDRAFDAFFSGEPRGVPQPTYAPRHTRPGHKPAPSSGRPSAKRPEFPGDGAGVDGNVSSVERRPVDESEDAATAWQTLRARYSPVAGRGAPPELALGAQAQMSAAAALLVKNVRLGRSRRSTASAGGGRFDLRATLRAALGTGGDPVRLRFLAHARRNPRFVMLVDGSRSMSAQTAAVVAFAAALCERSARTKVFFFSTGLREVTDDVRAAAAGGAVLADFGDAWGGGTKIGANLARFVREHGALLTPATLVFIYSDGLDVGDVPQLSGAMRELDFRSAGVVWLNPHAATPGYEPSARGMRAALPFVSLLCAANDVRGFERLAARVAQTPRLRGKRL
jgi:uncharacterized protein with von Willebrand factor type A (vWA) domain